MRGLKRFSRGSVLIFALILTVLITLIGLSLLGIKKGHYSASKLAVKAAEAKYLAHAGIHDAVAKLSKDPFFPSGVGDAHTFFSYQEELNDLDGGAPLGSYHVTVDQNRRATTGIVTIESVGQTVATGSATSGRHATYVEVDMRPASFGVIMWKEGTPP